MSFARSTPGFLERCVIAQDTYSDQTRLARASIAHLKEGCFRWHRPDISALVQLLTAHFKENNGEPLSLWTEESIVNKLLPLLIDWDIRQGPTPPPEAGEMQ